MSMERPTVYIVDDDAGVRNSLALLLELHGYQTRAFGSAEAFLEGFDPGASGCAIVDLRMPGMSGLEVIKVVSRMSPDIEIILLTAHGSLESAIEALRHEAFDYLLKRGLTPTTTWRCLRVAAARSTI